ncbi:MAG: methyltransferase domain-containing protein [Silvibacterium sp.]
MQHNAQILDQFTRQAEGFAQAKTIRNENMLERMLQAAQCGPEHTTLDVACGPGIVACAFARVARHATGIDLTPAMLEQARKTQAAQGLTNVSWNLGDVTQLPYRDGQFDVVTCRFVFHHLQEPLVVLKEMVRVCRPGGRIVVADTCPSADRAEAYDRVERLRDPSHTHALPPRDLVARFAAAGLPGALVESFRLPDELDLLLAHSFPREEDIPRIRAMFEEAVEDDFLDMAPSRRDGKIFFSFPVSIVAAQKNA